MSQCKNHRYFSLIVFCLILMGSNSCVTKDSSLSEGTQPSFLGYVPTRIVVFPCRTWPKHAQIAALPAANISNKILTETCSAFDSKVLQAFENQPYMNGISPKALQKVLTDHPTKLSDIDQLWERDATTCLDCTDPGAFYRRSIAARIPWRTWLQQIADRTKDGDAILMPFIISMQQNQFTDRGIPMMRHSGTVALLLIDSRNGDLIWFRSRTAILDQLAQSITAAHNPWDLLRQRLWIPYLWDGFPGRVTGAIL